MGKQVKGWKGGVLVGFTRLLLAPGPVPVSIWLECCGLERNMADVAPDPGGEAFLRIWELGFL